MSAGPQIRSTIGRTPLLPALALVAATGCTPNPVPGAHPDRSVPTPRVGALSGELRLLDRPGPEIDLRPVIVMLEPRASRPVPPPQRVTVRSASDAFNPGFAVVGPGDTIVFVNEGALSHRAFTAGVQGEIARMIPARAASRPLVLPRYGPVRFFCSLHPDETFLVFVSSAPFFTAVRPDGDYHIPDLPPGSYRLAIWSPVVAGWVREVELVAGRSVREPIWIDPDLLTR